MITKTHILPIILIPLLLASCATPYQPSAGSYMGGYTDRILGGGYYSVNFAGNGYTNKTRTSDLSLLRACELAQRDGYAKFVVLGAHNNNTVDYAQTPGYATTTGSYSYGSYSSQTIYTPPTSIAINKPDTNVSIQGLPASSKKGVSIALTIQNLRTKYRIQPPKTAS